MTTKNNEKLTFKELVAAYKNDAYAKFGEQNFADASRQAVVDMIADINSIF